MAKSKDSDSKAEKTKGAASGNGQGATPGGASPAPVPAPAPQESALQAPLTVLHQYLKDFSFENLLGADLLTHMEERPSGAVKVDVSAKSLNATDFEVMLHLSADAKLGDKPVYMVECEYGGVFRVGKVAQESVTPLIMIEAPRILFPFARQMIGLATQAGGFAPLFLSPIDFLSLFRQKIARQQAEQSAQQSA